MDIRTITNRLVEELSITYVQTWVLIHRYLVRLWHFKITSILRMIVAPCLILIPLYYVASTLDGREIPSNSLLNEVIIKLLLILPLIHFVNVLTKDIESEFKSLMFMMGLKKSSYLLSSWLIYNIGAIHILISSQIFMVLYEFRYSPKSTTLHILLLLYSQLFAYASLFASIIRRSRLSFLILLVIVIDTLFGVFVLHMSNLLIQTNCPIIVMRFLIFLSCFSPFQCFRNYSQVWYFRTVPNEKFQIISGQDEILAPCSIQETSTMIVMTSIFWVVLSNLFAYWFDQVCPWKNDSEIKSLFFCLNPKTQDNKQESYDNEPDDNCIIGSKYFEKVTTDRTTGIRLINVSKSFKSRYAVKNLSFRLFQGETTLLLGHNGAGKTTLMNMILGKLKLDEGRIVVKKHISIGVCPQSSINDPNLTVEQHLRLFARIKRPLINSTKLHSTVRDTLCEVGLENQSHCYTNTLSGGMLRKLNLGIAFVADSELLILDEPSSGLDPDSRMFIWNAIRKSRSDRTVLLSSQHMEEADYLGDRIAIMNKGEILCCGSSIFLKKIFGTGYKLRIDCKCSDIDACSKIIKNFFPNYELSNSYNESNDMLDSGEAINSINFVLNNNNNRSDENSSSHDGPANEMMLIKLLDFIETDANAQKLIKSFSLRSPSMEEVLLNTDRIFNSQDIVDQQLGLSRENSQLDLESSRTEQIMQLLTNVPTRNSSGNKIYTQISLFWALIMIRLQVLRYRWISAIICNILIPSLASLLIVASIILPNQIFGFSFFNILQRLLLGLSISIFASQAFAERDTKLKTVMFCSQLHWSTYWLSFLLMDSLIISLVMIIEINLFLKLPFKELDKFKSSDVGLISSFGIILFSISGSIISYLISFIISSSPVSKSSIIFNMNIFIWLIFFISYSIGSSFIRLVESSISLSQVLVSIFPQDSLAYIIFGTQRDYYSEPVNFGVIFDYTKILSPITHGFIALTLQIILGLVCLSLLEIYNIDIEGYLDIRRLYSILISYIRIQRNSPVNVRQLDENVVEEAITALKIVNGQANSRQQIDLFTLVAGNLSKSYSANKMVVNHLSFTVRKGECFGLLGINGAGKSTTFAMIVSEMRPTNGKVILNGISPLDNLTKYRTNIGYDPQQNPQISITGRQALTLMARLRLVHENVIPDVVNSILEILEMIEHGNKLISKMSGGTKRKLALGLSLIGNPKFLALDEPTAGVDPLARRKIWSLLSRLRSTNKMSILISSHAMEECESICDRISIISAGRLRCLGTFLKLQSKYAIGCTVRICIINQQDCPNESIMNITTDLTKRLELAFGQAVKMNDNNETSATYSIRCNLRRSRLLMILRVFNEKYPQISYMVNDLSLEDVFKYFASEGNEYV